MSARKLRILYVIGSLGNGLAGTERSLLTLIRHLDRSRFEPYLVSLQECDYTRTGEVACPSECLHINRMLTPWMIHQQRRLSRLMRERRIDIIQTFFTEAHLVAGLAARRAGVKTIISSRRNTGYTHTLKERLFLRMANRYAHRFLANSKAVADACACSEQVERERIDVIYNGVEMPDDFDTVQWDDDHPAGKQIIAVVANLRQVKGIDTLLEAVPAVRRQLPRVRVKLIGEGSERSSLETQAARLGISETVEFMGAQENVSALLRDASVGVLTSRSEGFSNAILEYMRAGIPVVATDVGGNREAVEDGRTGYLVPLGNTHELTRRIVELLTDRALLRKMGHAGRRRVAKYFSLERMMHDYEAYYDRLASGCPTP